MLNEHITDDIQSLHASDNPTDPSQSPPAIVRSTDTASCSSLVEPLEHRLTVATNSNEVNQIRASAEAMRVLLRNMEARLDEQNKAAKVRLLAERRLGQELANMEKATGTRGQLVGRGIIGSSTTLPPITGEIAPPLRLTDLGITKSQSSRWQGVAAIPEDVFERYIAETDEASQEITTVGLVRYAKRKEKEAQPDGNPSVTEPAGGKKPAVGGECASAVPDVKEYDAEANQSDSAPVETQMREVVTEGDESAPEDAMEPPEQPEPARDEDNGGREMPEAQHRQQDVVTESTLSVYPNADPHNDREPLWWRGALQLVSQLAQEASTLDDPPNSDRISDPTLQLIDVLAPIFLETPIPRGRRGKILELLLYCGYRDFVDQLVCRWAAADEAAASGQPEQLDLEKWISTEAAAPNSPESQAGLPNPARDTVVAEANP
jgi:hypothetical protein